MSNLIVFLVTVVLLFLHMYGYLGDYLPPTFLDFRVFEWVIVANFFFLLWCLHR